MPAAPALAASALQTTAELDAYTALAIAGMTLITLLSRSSFFLLPKHWKMPPWLERGLHYAPIAALAAVVFPEILLQQGLWITPWTNAKLYGFGVGFAVYLYRRHVLLTMCTGTAVYMLLRHGLGW